MKNTKLIDMHVQIQAKAYEINKRMITNLSQKNPAKVRQEKNKN